jgi:hypothetical protein
VKKATSNVFLNYSNRVQTKLARKNSRLFSFIFAHLQKQGGGLQQNQMSRCAPMPYLLAPGARFEFRGRQLKKTAITMAQDSERVGNIFQSVTEVNPIGEPLSLPEAEALDRGYGAVASGTRV